VSLTNTILTPTIPGQDGFSGVNSTFGKDLSAFSLAYTDDDIQCRRGGDKLYRMSCRHNTTHYFLCEIRCHNWYNFNGDFTPINWSSPIASVNNSSHAASNSSQLFNGNIRYMQTRLTNLTTGAAMPMLNAYKYDQLNRLSQARSYESGLSGSVWNPTTYGNSYYNAFTYDAMGNNLTQLRHKRDGTKIEDLSYSYQTSGGKLVRNRLYHLDDVVGSGVDATDIDDMGTFDGGSNINSANNYSYDEEGRLVKDVQEKISKIVWRVDGKVKEIQRMTGSTKWLKFDYDAMGDRIAKHVFSNNGTTLERSTYYILDAQGNQISTYDHEIISETTQFNLKENNIYGSSRIGNLNRNVNVLTSTISSNYASVLGGKYYEFSNHLGNVLTVFSDLKIPKDTDNNNVVDGYEIGVVSTADYSPFGVQLDGRTDSAQSYRYGFNGMEKDDEVKGNGNSYTTEFRQYDPRLGRWLSLDPLAGQRVSHTPYNFGRNNPIIMTDPSGALDDWYEDKEGNVAWFDERGAKGSTMQKDGKTWTNLGDEITVSVASEIRTPNDTGIPGTEGVKLTDDYKIKGGYGDDGNFSHFETSFDRTTGKTFGIIEGAPSVPGKTNSYNKIDFAYDINWDGQTFNYYKGGFEQHTQVGKIEEPGLRLATGGYIVDVNQKVSFLIGPDINWGWDATNKKSTATSNGGLYLSMKIGHGTFPSLSVKVNDKIVYNYWQKSFVMTHTVPGSPLSFQMGNDLYGGDLIKDDISRSQLMNKAYSKTNVSWINFTGFNAGTGLMQMNQRVYDLLKTP
jgi:RHS repeat-associated protein